MSSPVSVESLASGNARDQIPDSQMESSGNQATTSIGAVVKQDTGVVWHKFKSEQTWEHAVYHSLIRRHLIKFEKRKGAFDIEPTSGREEDDDVTSYHVDQKTWGPERKDFPSILFVYDRPKATKGQASTRFMYFNRMLVLDKDHRPVKAFPELNSTLSSKAEGFRLEAISRLNLKISSRDILARMPSEITRTDTRGGRAKTRPQCKANALSMRRRDFRGKNGFLSWVPREGSEGVKKYIDSLMPPDLIALNTTRGMRPLTDDEVNHILTLGGKGTHPERSRHKGSKSGPSAPKRTKGARTKDDEEDEASESAIPTDVDDHFEPITPDANEDVSAGLGIPPDSTEDPLRPMNPGDVDDESSAIQTPPAVADLDFDDMLDRRNHVPLNDRGMRVIADAMEPTVRQYENVLNINITFGTADFQRESYNVQWSTMQENFERRWAAQGRDPEECPQLTRYERWEAEKWNWLGIPMGG